MARSQRSTRRQKTSILLVMSACTHDAASILRCAFFLTVMPLIWLQAHMSSACLSYSALPGDGADGFSNEARAREWLGQIPACDKSVPCPECGFKVRIPSMDMNVEHTALHHQILRAISSVGQLRLLTCLKTVIALHKFSPVSC